MMAAWRSVLHRPWSPPTPAPIVHLGAFLLGSDPALALTGRRGVPRRLLDAGFAFEHPSFAPAIAALLGPDRGSPPPSSRSNVAGSQRRGKTPSPM
jgi:NAD dependent epimerase/dehydratase family enzyme